MDIEPRDDTPKDTDVVGAVDAFMSRLRPPAEDDVPLLTDVVEGPLPPVPGGTPATAPEQAAPLSADAQAALRQELEDWLDMHLTEAVLRVIDGVADQLVARIAEQARDDLLPRLEAALARSQQAPTAGE